MHARAQCFEVHEKEAVFLSPRNSNIQKGLFFITFMQHKVLFTSDLHGNLAQYIKLVDYAIDSSADSIIIGGDIAPKDFPDRFFISGQRRFLEERLPELLSPIKERLPDSRVFLMMANDDCAANLDVLEKDDPNLYQLIHGKRIKLTEQFDIVGYSYVPITPFGIKDWEKYDFSEVPRNLLEEYEERKRTQYRLDGFKSAKKGTKLRSYEFRFTPETEKRDSIQKDLFRDSFCGDAHKTVYVFHAPPDRTNLDQVYYEFTDIGVHVGSMAVRLFIETYQPFLTFHGHCHETVDLSGEFKEKIGGTLCLSSGNDHSSSQLTFLEFDLYKPEDVERKRV